MKDRGDRLDAFGIRVYRITLKISWTEHIRPYQHKKLSNECIQINHFQIVLQIAAPTHEHMLNRSIGAKSRNVIGGYW